MSEQETKFGGRKIFWILILVLIIVASGNYLWQRFGKELVLLQTTAPSSPIIVNLQEKITQNQTAIQQLQEEMQKQQAFDAMNWQPLAVEYLVRMADLTLNTNRDVKTAVAFLATAKKYAEDFKDQSLIRVLNTDIVKLQAVPAVAIEELVMKLDLISQQINNLPTAPTSAPSATPITVTETQQYSDLLKRFFTSVIKSLKDIVIIRHQTVEPMEPPEQMKILRFDIQNKLLQAELAAMQKQNKVYQMCLTQVIDLVNKYFAINKNAATSILQTIQELRQINLQPELPSLAESITAIHAFIKTFGTTKKL